MTSWSHSATWRPLDLPPVADEVIEWWSAFGAALHESGHGTFRTSPDRGQSTLFPERLDDYLGEDNPHFNCLFKAAPGIIFAPGPFILKIAIV
jgi:hypothetical protein